jgi:hypothetical protein
MKSSSIQKKLFMALVFLCFWLASADNLLQAQKKVDEFLGGAYKMYSIKQGKYKFRVLDLDMSSSQRIKARYFSTNAKKDYKSWKKYSRKDVICYFAVGFSNDLEGTNAPLGLCVDNGSISNRNMDAEMDGLILVDQYGNLAAADLEHQRIDGYNLRRASEKTSFLRSYLRSNGSAFQTQLLYSAVAGDLMGSFDYGKKASRRFLAICKDRRGRLHHLVIDLIESAYLNDAARHALTAIKSLYFGYEVEYLLNQDTGARNIMTAFDEKGRKIYSSPVEIADATQLLVYYY